MKKDSDNSRYSSVLDVIDIVKESESEIIIYEPNTDEVFLMDLKLKIISKALKIEVT